MVAPPEAPCNAGRRKANAALEEDESVQRGQQYNHYRGRTPGRRIIYALAGISYISFRGGAMRGAGEIVLPGSMTPIYPVDAADKVEAEFEALGSVSARFV
jgi:hypothetical protein